MENAIELIQEERERQIDVEGFSKNHDDKHINGELRQAASAYHYSCRFLFPGSWDISWYKPTSRKRDLVKAGALYQAEIERVSRMKLEVEKEINGLKKSRI